MNILAAILLICMIQIMYCEESVNSGQENNSANSVSGYNSIIDNVGQVVKEKNPMELYKIIKQYYSQQ